MKHIAVIAIVTTLLLACAEKKTPQIKPDVDQFFQVYETYLLLAESKALTDSQKTAILDSALAAHTMTAAQFDTTLNYLASHPREFYEQFRTFSKALEDTLEQSPAD
ncbi:MAG: hypothetical protein U5R06_07120 [candidate division KSB1 bacterium]|nr:hypothetical protein [candidate division KSB1 bacterium]